MPYVTPLETQQSKFPTRIPMDGATLRKWKDGRITIKRNTFIIWAQMVFFGLVVAGLSLSALGSLRQVDWEDVTDAAPWLCGLGGIFIFLMSLSRRPSIEINVGSNAVNIRRRTDSLLIPFSSIAHMAITDKSESGTQQFEIAAVLHAGERILMGSVSGFKGDATHARARTIATIIAQATHATVVDPTESSIPLDHDFALSGSPLLAVPDQANDQRLQASRRFLWFGLGVLIFLLLVLAFVVLILPPTL